MADKKKKNSKPEMNILDKISTDDGLAILKMLAKEDASLLKRIEHAALEYFKEVKVEDIADEVFWELDSLEVEDVWDQSCPKLKDKAYLKILFFRYEKN